MPSSELAAMGTSPAPLPLRPHRSAHPRKAWGSCHTVRGPGKQSLTRWGLGFLLIERNPQQPSPTNSAGIA